MWKNDLKMLTERKGHLTTMKEENIITFLTGLINSSTRKGDDTFLKSVKECHQEGRKH